MNPNKLQNQLFVWIAKPSINKKSINLTCKAVFFKLQKTINIIDVKTGINPNKKKFGDIGSLVNGFKTDIIIAK